MSQEIVKEDKRDPNINRILKVIEDTVIECGGFYKAWTRERMRGKNFYQWKFKELCDKQGIEVEVMVENTIKMAYEIGYFAEITNAVDLYTHYPKILTKAKTHYAKIAQSDCVDLSDWIEHFVTPKIWVRYLRYITDNGEYWIYEKFKARVAQAKLDKKRVRALWGDEFHPSFVRDVKKFYKFDYRKALAEPVKKEKTEEEKQKSKKLIEELRKKWNKTKVVLDEEETKDKYNIDNI